MDSRTVLHSVELVCRKGLADFWKREENPKEYKARGIKKKKEKEAESLHSLGVPS